MAMSTVDPYTDPRASGPIPKEMIPSVIADARRAASEVRIACDSIVRGCVSADVQAEAARLLTEAIRLGQAANLMSALPVGEEGALVWMPPRLPRWRKLRILFRMALKV